MQAAGHRRPGPSWVSRWRTRWRTAGYEVDGPLGAGRRRRRRRCRPAVRPRRARSPRAAAQIAPGPLVGHCSGATGLGALAPHEAFSLHPLMTVTADGADFAGAGAADRRQHPPRAGAGRASWRGALGMRAVEIADARPRRLPRRRVDRLELPDHARGRGRAARRHRRRSSATSSSRWSAPRSRTGRVSGPSGRSPGRWRAATRSRSPVSAPPWTSAAPELLRLFDALVRATRALAAAATGGPAGMNVIRTVAELRADAARAPARRPHDRPGSDDGRVPRGPPVADAPGPPGLRRGRRVAVREPRAVQRRRRPRRATRATRSATPALAAEVGVDYLFAPPVEEVYPPGFATTVSVAGSPRRSRAPHRGRAHFDGVTTVVTKLFNMVGARRGLLRPEGRAAGAGHPPARARPRHARSRIEVCPTVREPDGLALSSRNVQLSPDDRARATALHRALSPRCRTPCAPASATRRRPARAALAELAARGHRAGVRRARRRPTRWRPCAGSTGDVLVVLAARVGDTRLIDNQLIQRVASTTTARWRPRPCEGANHRVRSERKCPQPPAFRSPTTSTPRSR